MCKTTVKRYGRSGKLSGKFRKWMCTVISFLFWQNGNCINREKSKTDRKGWIRPENEVPDMAQVKSRRRCRIRHKHTTGYGRYGKDGYIWEQTEKRQKLKRNYYRQNTAWKRHGQGIRYRREKTGQDGWSRREQFWRKHFRKQAAWSLRHWRDFFAVIYKGIVKIWGIPGNRGISFFIPKGAVTHHP